MTEPLPEHAAAPFRALVARRDGDVVTAAIEEWRLDDLSAGEVTIAVSHSSVNYKDALAVRADGRVARSYPLIPGIDMAGTVVDSADPAYARGDEVIAHGFDIGMSHHGGFAEVGRVPGSWVVPLPAGLSAHDAMARGTAGFTAAMAVDRLERDGVAPSHGPIVVTGATGGLGSWAVAMLAARGYDVVASTRDPAGSLSYLHGLGAATVIDAAVTSAVSDRPLEHARWAGAVDAVGGSTLAYLLRTMRQGGIIATAGNTGGARLETSVFPFILRGVGVHGMDSAAMPIGPRRELWARMGGDLRPPRTHTPEIRDVSLDALPDALAAVHRGEVRGRVVVVMDATAVEARTGY